jgi:glutaredoxin 3
MSRRRKIEVFSAGCAVCEEAVRMVRENACASCELTVLDMHDPEVARRARRLGVRSVPAVAIDGRLAACCAGRGPEESALRAAGLCKPIV